MDTMHSVSNYVPVILPALKQPSLIVMTPDLRFKPCKAEVLRYSTPTRHLGTSHYT